MLQLSSQSNSFVMPLNCMLKYLSPLVFSVFTISIAFSKFSSANGREGNQWPSFPQGPAP